MVKRRDRPFDYVAIINHRPVHHRPSCRPRRPGEGEAGERDGGENMEDSCDDDEKRIEFQYMTAPYRYRPSLPVALHSPLRLFKLPL